LAVAKEVLKMTKVLVVYASRHRGTRGIAERIREVLRTDGLDAVVSPAELAGDVRSVDAVVVGSGVYMGSWLKEGIDFLERNEAALVSRPVWLFSSGPLRGSSSEKRDAGKDPIEAALGPIDGPGSGGRKRIAELSAVMQPRGHKVFYGAFDPKDPARGMAERLVRLTPAARGLLPAGDFRDWPVIEAWAHEIARELQPVGAAG
jgi:menaquinone-dependent protoporphyrinogen oxidase